jgi:hypothetical protein
VQQRLDLSLHRQPGEGGMAGGDDLLPRQPGIVRRVDRQHRCQLAQQLVVVLPAPGGSMPRSSPRLVGRASQPTGAVVATTVAPAGRSREE